MTDRAPQDEVNHPPHYTGGKVECIEVLEQLGLDFRLSNVIKYIWRHREKGGVKDLRKALWYLERYIERDADVPQIPATTPADREKDLRLSLKIGVAYECALAEELTKKERRALRRVHKEIGVYGYEEMAHAAIVLLRDWCKARP